MYNFKQRKAENISTWNCPPPPPGNTHHIFLEVKPRYKVWKCPPPSAHPWDQLTCV